VKRPPENPAETLPKSPLCRDLPPNPADRRSSSGNSAFRLYAARASGRILILLVDERVA